MNLGRVITSPCSNSAPPPDARCGDPAFALLNPNICGVSSQLIVKPQVALCCQLGGVQFKAIIVSNGQEQDVTSKTVFTTSNPNVAVVGASSGNATGLADGDAMITATYNGLASSASLSVLGGGNCCADIKVGSLVVVDVSKSMTQGFNGGYAQKIDFAKAAAKSYINGVNKEKDLVGLATFDDSGYHVLSAPISDIAAVAALVDGITSANQLTGYKTAVNSAIEALNALTVDQKILVLISDGEDTSASADDASGALSSLNTFKSAGGVVLCMGVRVSGTAFSLLEAFSTGGFFVNSYDTAEVAALQYMNGLKGYLCAGNCAPTGDTFSAKGQLDYCGFKNWNVRGGHVDLIGNSFIDFLPGNGLYVDLAGADAPHNGAMESKNSFALIKNHSYRLSLSLAGNQRAAGAPNTVNMKIFGRNNDGIVDPNAAPVLVVNESGAALISQPAYKYVYTYVNANGETAPSPVSSATPTTANASITVQAVASASATAINIYRTTGESPDSQFFLIATIAATAPAYVDHMNETDMLAAFLTGVLDSCAVAPATNTTGSQVNYLNQSVTINDYQQPFLPQSFTFVAPDNIAVWIRFQQTATPAGAPSAGLLLDNVSFDDTTNVENLLSDDFSAENMTYTPPACGLGQSYVKDGGNTYSQTSSDTVTTPLIPVMTSNTTPSGVASASSEFNNGSGTIFYAFNAFSQMGDRWISTGVAPGWFQYQFPTPQIANSYDISSLVTGGTGSWNLSGSNDGISFTVLDTKTLAANPNLDGISFVNSTAYLYYRVTFTAGVFNSSKVNASNFQLYSTVSVPIYSYISSYGYLAGYYGCYGTGCLDTPPPVQLQDPNPLPNIEASGYTPPKQYSSTQQSCVTCPNGGTQVLTDNAAAGSNTRVESADGTYFNFDTPAILNIICWTFTATAAFTLSVNGSNDGVNWVQVFLTSNRGFAANPNGSVDLLASRASCCTFDPVQFKYFKLVYDKSKAALSLYSFGGVRFAPGPQLCKTASASSLISQADADAKALAQATSLANAAIQCIQAFSATESFTANCPTGQSGQSVTKTVTYISLISQQDAEVQALALAQAQANAAISCACTDTSAGKITINDNSAASPYPAVKCVSGKTGLITKVTVAITGFQHTYPNDVSMVLVSPKGTIVNLMRNCGGNVLVTGVNLVFDDAAGGSLNNTTLVSGTYKPTQIGPFAAFPQPCPSGTPSATLAAFNGEDANGAWLLFVQDIKQLDVGQIASGFSLTITTA